MVLEEDLPKGGLRLLEVDNPLVLPINTKFVYWLPPAMYYILEPFHLLALKLMLAQVV